MWYTSTKVESSTTSSNMEFSSTPPKLKPSSTPPKTELSPASPKIDPSTNSPKQESSNTPSNLDDSTDHKDHTETKSTAVPKKTDFIKLNAERVIAMQKRERGQLYRVDSSHGTRKMVLDSSHPTGRLPQYLVRRKHEQVRADCKVKEKMEEQERVEQSLRYSCTEKENLLKSVEDCLSRLTTIYQTMPLVIECSCTVKTKFKSRVEGLMDEAEAIIHHIKNNDVVYKLELSLRCSDLFKKVDTCKTR